MEAWAQLRDALITFAVGMLTIALPILGTILGLWMKAQLQLLQAKLKDTLSQQQNDVVDFIITNTVRAVEQYYKDFDGDEKKARAMDMAEQWLKRRGVTVPLAELDALLESSVNQEFNWGRERSDLPVAADTPILYPPAGATFATSPKLFDQGASTTPKD